MYYKINWLLLICIVNTFFRGWIILILLDLSGRKKEELCCIKLIGLFSICIVTVSIFIILLLWLSSQLLELKSKPPWQRFVDSLCLSTYVLLILVCFKLILYVLVEMFDHDLFCCNLSKFCILSISQMSCQHVIECGTLKNTYISLFEWTLAHICFLDGWY